MDMPQYKAVLSAFSLGELTAPPTPLSGGLMHRMYRVETARGVWALKCLNPAVMRRSGLRTTCGGRSASRASWPRMSRRSRPSPCAATRWFFPTARTTCSTRGSRAPRFSRPRSRLRTVPRSARSSDGCTPLVSRFLSAAHPGSAGRYRLGVSLRSSAPGNASVGAALYRQPAPVRPLARGCAGCAVGALRRPCPQPPRSGPQKRLMGGLHAPPH